jgi:PQQ-like domain
VAPAPRTGRDTADALALAPGSGAVVASFAASGPISGSPAIGDPNASQPWVFLGDDGGNIYAIDSTDEFPPPIWQAALGGPVDGPARAR